MSLRATEQVGALAGTRTARSGERLNSSGTTSVPLPAPPSTR
jgi:hypothetical protein